MIEPEAPLVHEIGQHRISACGSHRHDERQVLACLARLPHLTEHGLRKRAMHILLRGKNAQRDGRPCFQLLRRDGKPLIEQGLVEHVSS